MHGDITAETAHKICSQSSRQPVCTLMLDEPCEAIEDVPVVIPLLRRANEITSHSNNHDIWKK